MEPGPRPTIAVNFQASSTPPPSGFLVDSFAGFGPRDGDLSYGWVTEASALDADGTTAIPITGDYPGAIVEVGGAPPAASDPRLVGSAAFDAAGWPSRAAWELALEAGWYEVTASLGDAGLAGGDLHALEVEGAPVTSWTSAEPFTSQLVTTVAHVEDGFLTLSAASGDGARIHYVEVRPLPDLTPDDDRPAPEDYPAFVDVVANGGFGANQVLVPLDPGPGVRPDGVDPRSDLLLGIDSVDGRGGALLESLADGSLALYETLSGAPVAFTTNTTGGFDAVTISPTEELAPFTSYTLAIDGFQDRGATGDAASETREFLRYTTTFTTGEAPAIPPREVAFASTVELDGALEGSFGVTSIALSPDAAFLYAVTMGGQVKRWAIDPATGALDVAGEEVFTPLGDFVVDPDDPVGGRRGFIGLAFDPVDPNVLWVSDNYPIPLVGKTSEIPDFTGRISKIELGADGSLSDATISPYVSGLPRSGGDHLVNSLAFRPNPAAGEAGEPDHLLYVTVGSNTAMGAPDNTWSFRPERLLSAAVLEIDPERTAPPGGFDVTTEPLPDDGFSRRFVDADDDLKNGGIPITSGAFFDPDEPRYLHFDADGVASVRTGPEATAPLVADFYDPFADDAVVRLFATGHRNSYDLAWHSNGSLYAAMNGSAPGGNTPGGTRPDGTVVPALFDLGLQEDFLVRVLEGRYYGHPNPLHDEFVAYGGNPTAGVDNDPNEVDEYPAGVLPDPNYDLAGSYPLGPSRSPNGIIEYRADVFGSSLQGALLFAEYSSGDDIRVVLLDEAGLPVDEFLLTDPTGEVIEYADVLDITEGVDGRLYLSTLNRGNGGSQIVRLDPRPDATADENGDLAVFLVDGTDPAAAHFRIYGLDDDIAQVLASLDGGLTATAVTVGPDGEFTLDLGTFDATALQLTVIDDATNEASVLRPLAPPDATAVPDARSLDAAYFPDRLQFNWIDEITTAIGSHKPTATLEVVNTGTSPLQLLGADLAGPFRLEDPTVVDATTLAPGEATTIVVAFDRAAYTPPLAYQTSVVAGELRLQTNAAATPLLTVDLGGFWRPEDTPFWEPNINEVWEVFGFDVLVEGVGFAGNFGDSPLDNFDIYEAVDELEVLSPYWQLADGVEEARLVRLATMAAPETVELGLHRPGSLADGDRTVVTTNAPDQNQAFLPVQVDHSIGIATFTAEDLPDAWPGDDVFGVFAADRSSDPRLNEPGSGEVDPSLQRGHFIRFFEARDADGAAIPHLYLGVMENGTSNYNYNDHLFLLEGVAPVGFDVGEDLGLPGGDDVVYSPAPDRSAPLDLDGAVFAAGEVFYAFLETTDTTVARVDFVLDGALLQREGAAPWDLQGGFLAAANGFDTATLDPGDHVLETRLFATDAVTPFATLVDAFEVVGETAAGLGDVRYSPLPDRTGPLELDGADFVQGGTIYAFLDEADATITGVEFFLDGTLIQTERAAPWDIQGGFAAAAEGLDTTLLAPGTYVVETVITHDAGGEPATTTLVDSFTILAEPDTGTPPPYDVRYSASAGRSAPVDLDGAVFTRGETIYAFVDEADAAVVGVEFFLDGARIQTERAAPWDIQGGSLAAANGLATGELALGEHRIETRVVHEVDGTPEIVTLVDDFALIA